MRSGLRSPADLNAADIPNNAQVPGVETDMINAALAVPACRSAVAAQPADPPHAQSSEVASEGRQEFHGGEFLVWPSRRSRLAAVAK